MRTIGRHWPHKKPNGDFTATCDYCGAAFRRSQMTRLPNGLLACAEDATGRDEVTLDRLNAAAAVRYSPRKQGSAY